MMNDDNGIRIVKNQTENAHTDSVTEQADGGTVVGLKDGEKTAAKPQIGRDRFNLKSSPVFAIVVVIMFTLGIVLLPGEKLGKLFGIKSATDAANLGNAIFRAIGFTVAVLLCLDLGYDVFGFKGRGKGLLLSLPFIIVAVNNAPITGIASGTVKITNGGISVFYFALYCIFVGLFEEIVFRGIIQRLVLSKMKKTKVGTFWGIIITSALFGAIHAVNYLGGNFGGTTLQIGYSFLIGAMCSVVMLLTRNVFACAVLHAGFNFAGLIADTLGTGQVWDAVNITLTAVIGVAAAVYAVIVFIKFVKSEDL